MADEKKVAESVDYKAVSVQALMDGKAALKRLSEALPSDGGSEPDVVKNTRSGLAGAASVLDVHLVEIGA